MPLNKNPPISPGPAKPSSPLPLPPPVPVSSNHPLAQPGPLERKTSPDADAGYNSEAEDPPADYYHGSWRSHDRARNPDEADRKKSRGMATGWERSARPDAKTSDFFRRTSGAHYYKQAEPFCFAVCGAYAYMRRRGFSPEKIVFNLKRPAMITKMKRWQKFYESREGKFEGGWRLADTIADLFSKIEKDIGEVLEGGIAAPDAKKSGKSDAVPNIVFSSVIGHFPPENTYARAPKKTYATKMALGGNFVMHRPHTPSDIPALTFHQALFANFQPPRALQLPHPSLKNKRIMTRTVTPLVLLSLDGRDNNEAIGHAIMVDFTDPAHPGVFDPNYGWIEPRQGFCFLDFEQLMHSVWEQYTQNNTRNPRQGLGQIRLGKNEEELAIIAFQLYVQSG